MLKRILLFAALSTGLLAAPACKKESDNNPSTDKVCNKDSAGRQLYLGPQGGCYYINSGGNKTYVARAECNC